jgi:cellulose synthase/poly-beta-1,6-N-acetylglucosamine synthase-like glycosyltransferase
VILIDDQSEDNSYALVKAFMEEEKAENFLLISGKAGEKGYPKGKKGAIVRGIAHAKGPWIISSDADCRRSGLYLQSFSDYMHTHDAVFISGPVMFHEEKSGFEKMQSLEFSSLIGIGAAGIANKMPGLCNGANIAYLKEYFYKVNAYQGNEQYASGDDEFLMLKIAKLAPKKLHFLKSKEALVQTKAQQKPADFFHQRKRWVSKNASYNPPYLVFTVFLVWIFHAFILITATASLFHTAFLPFFLILFTVKISAELIFCIPVWHFFGKLKFIHYYPLSAVFYVVYVVFIAIISQFGKYSWKGRRFR